MATTAFVSDIAYSSFSPDGLCCFSFLTWNNQALFLSCTVAVFSVLLRLLGQCKMCTASVGNLVCPLKIDQQKRRV